MGLEAYDWPGNVRDLENTMERAVALEAGKEIPARVLPDRILGYGSSSATVPGASQGIAIPDEGVDFEKVVAATERLDMQAALEQRPLLCGGCMSLKLFSRARLLWCGPTKIRGTA